MHISDNKFFSFNPVVCYILQRKITHKTTLLRVVRIFFQILAHISRRVYFAEWLVTYADQLSRNCYPIIKNEIFKFLFSATTTTQGITVTTTTAFLPELSSVKPPLFFFTYRISISMEPECSVVSVKDSGICCYCALLCKCFLKHLKVSRHSLTRCKGFFGSL